MRESPSDREKKEREKQVACWTERLTWGFVPGPQDHSLSWRKMLNRPSHSGTPYFNIFCNKNILMKSEINRYMKESITDPPFPLILWNRDPPSRIKICSQSQEYIVPARNLHEYNISKSSVSLVFDTLKQDFRDMHVHPEEYPMFLLRLHKSKLSRDEVLLFPWICYVH